MTASANRRFRLNILANGFSRLNATLIQLFGTPLFLVFWGVDLYGEWLLLATIPTYLMLGDVGFSGVAQNEMSIRTSAGDRAAALRIFKAAFIFLILIFVLGAGLVAGALWFVPFETWFNFSKLDHQAAWLVVVWLLVKLAATQIIGLVIGVFRAEGRNAQGITHYNVTVLGQYVIMITAVGLGVSPENVAAIDAFLSVLVLAVFWRFGKRLWPDLGVFGANLRAGEIRRLVRPSLAFFGCTMSQALVLQGSTTLVGVLLGPQAVVVFNTMRTLTRIPQQVVETVANSLGPEMSLAHGASDLETMRRLYRQAIALNIWSAAAVCVVLMVAGQPFYEFWTRGEVIWDSSLFLGLLVVVCTGALYHSGMVLILSINKAEMIAPTMLISSALTLVVAVPLVQTLGVMGMAVALVVDGGLRIVLTQRSVKSVLGEKASDMAFYVGVTFWRDARGYATRRLGRLRHPSADKRSGPGSVDPE